MFEIVRDQTLSFDDKVFVEIMGSYRRGEANSGDIDILITRDPSDGKTHKGLIGKVVEALSSKGFITHAVSFTPFALSAADPSLARQTTGSTSSASGWACAGCRTACTGASTSSPSLGSRKVLRCYTSPAMLS